MRIYDYMKGILGAMGVGEDVGVPEPSWRIEEYLKAIYDKLKEGGGSSLPSVSSADNGKVLAVENGAWAAGERNYVVTITYNGLSYSADKTYAEILDAVHDGFNVVAKFANEWYTLTYVNEHQTIGTICFSSIVDSYNGVQTISISRNNNVKKKAEKKFLPLAESSDNGSELIVKNGDWTKQQKKFIVTLTPTSPDYSGTMDKTVAEMTEAYNAGMQIVWRVIMSETRYVDVNVTVVMTETDYAYPSFNAYVIEINAGVLVYAYIPITDDGTTQTYSTELYPLTPAS